MKAPITSEADTIKITDDFATMDLLKAENTDINDKLRLFLDEITLVKAEHSLLVHTLESKLVISEHDSMNLDQQLQERSLMHSIEVDSIRQELTSQSKLN